MFFRGSNKADLQRCRYDCFQAQIKVTALTPHIITTVCLHSPTSGTSVVLALITSQLKCLFVLLLNLTAWNLQTPCREKLFTNRSDKRPESPTIVQLVQPHRPPARSLNPSTPPEDGSVGGRRSVGALTAPPNQTVTPCDGRTGWASRRHPETPAGVEHSSELCYFWQADYVMSRDGFTNPAACVCVCVHWYDP